MSKSAYNKTNISTPEVGNSVIVFMHDFFDSPHIYGNMTFNNFLEWIEFSIITLEKYKISYYLKPHPNQTSDSKKVVDELKVKYPYVKFISSKVTNKQLVDGGIAVGISVYGSVAHELSYMGIPVILSSENPHSSYSFCFEARSKDEYENLIKNCISLNLPIDYKEQVESFYYMHNLNKDKDELDLITATNKLRKINTLSQDSEEKVFEIIREQINIIGSNKSFIDFIQKADIKEIK